MPRPKKGRHRAPRQPLRPSTVAVPAVLLMASGGAFAGLAGVPAVSGAQPVRAAAAADLTPEPVALPRATYAKDLDLLDAASDRAQQAQAVAQQRARTAAAERASRTRRAQLDTQARMRAAAAAKAAAATRARLRSAAVLPASGRVTSPFGPRWGGTHLGVDIASPNGAPVRAAMAGEVIEAGFDAGGYGNYVRLLHADGTVTTYNHMSRILRRAGQVAAGDLVGLIGSTGRSTGNHLHFEVRIDGTPVDPLPWLRRRGVTL